MKRIEELTEILKQVKIMIAEVIIPQKGNTFKYKVKGTNNEPIQSNLLLYETYLRPEIIRLMFAGGVDPVQPLD